MKIEKYYSFFRKILTNCWHFLIEYSKKNEPRKKLNFSSDPEKIKQDLIKAYNNEEISNISQIINNANQNQISIKIHKEPGFESDRDLFFQSMLEKKQEIFKIFLSYSLIDVNYICDCKTHKFEHSLFVHAMLDPDLLWAATLLINKEGKADLNYAFYIEETDAKGIKASHKYNILLYLIKFCPNSKTLAQLIENGDDRLDFDSEYEGYEYPPILQAIFYNNLQALELLTDKKQKNGNFFAVNINQTKLKKIVPFVFAFEHQNYDACKFIKTRMHFCYQTCEEYIEKFDQLFQNLEKKEEKLEALEETPIIVKNTSTYVEPEEQNNIPVLDQKEISQEANIVTAVEEISEEITRPDYSPLSFTRMIMNQIGD